MKLTFGAAVLLGTVKVAFAHRARFDVLPLASITKNSAPSPPLLCKETTTNQIVLARLGRPIPRATTSQIGPVASVSVPSIVAPTGSPEGGVISTASISSITSGTPATPVYTSQEFTTVTGATLPSLSASISPAKASSPTNESPAVAQPTLVSSYILPIDTGLYTPSTATSENVGTVVDPGNYPLQSALAPTSDGVNSAVQSGVNKLSSSSGTVSSSNLGSARSSSPWSFDIKGGASMNALIIPFSALLVFTLL